MATTISLNIASQFVSYLSGSIIFIHFANLLVFHHLTVRVPTDSIMPLFPLLLTFHTLLQVVLSMISSTNAD